jgi:uncharacterized protein YutE (UPF0331/DUF86 family)
MIDDIIINKTETIRLCLKRIREEYINFEGELQSNYTKQDSIILNIQRAAQASIDLSTHIIRVNKLGVPKTSRDVFTLLESSNILSINISEKMKKMVGFRNIAVHDYQNISFDVVKSILDNHLIDFENFIQEITEAK